MEQWYRHVCSGGCPSILTWDVFTHPIFKYRRALAHKVFVGALLKYLYIKC